MGYARRLRSVAWVTGVGVVVMVVLFPVYWAFATSVTPSDDLLGLASVLYPPEADFSPYHFVLFERPLLTWIGNSLLFSLISVALAMLVAMLAAYSLSRFASRTGTIIAYALLATRMIPGPLMAVPLYIMFSEWGLVNTRVAVILAYLIFEIPFATWLLKGYFDTIPPDLERAAEIDGCSPLGSFLRITVPLSLPGIAAAGIASLMLAWSDYEYARALLSSQSLWPITVGIHSFFGEHVIHWNAVMAGSIISVLPIVALYMLMERYIVDGLTAGALK